MDHSRDINFNICTKQRLERKPWNRPNQFLTLYRRYRNHLTKLTRTTHEQCYRNLLESLLETVKVWSNVNSILGKKHRSQNTPIRLNGIIVSKPEQIASTFNSYFNIIPATLSSNISNNAITFESYVNYQIPVSEKFTQTSLVEISKVIHKLKNSNSVGWDNIQPKIIKSNVNILPQILSNLINKSLAQGVFSD